MCRNSANVKQKKMRNKPRKVTERMTRYISLETIEF